MLIDDLDQPPERVVSLVPSLTESLFDMRLGAAVVGITDYCVHPAEALKRLPRVGGTKDPDVNRITSLQPDLVLVNQEENTPGVVEELQANGIRVWLTFPKNVDEALEVLRQLAGLFQSQTSFLQIDALERAVEFAAQAAEDLPRWRYFCPIWYQERPDASPWWMTFNADTYAHDVLRIFGGENVFAGRERKYPLAAELDADVEEQKTNRDRRYPRVFGSEILELAPEVILLPDEPYHFDSDQAKATAAQLATAPAARNGRIYRFDGSLISWHGTRLAMALNHLPSILSD